MTVDESRGSINDNESKDRFPVGMRVLAVDDDPICLKLLENLLRRCEYHVTTTNQAVTALKLLRENKNKFDLVISDVHMPDMDGFKLLELVGLEMDLPVIMLSANGDPKLVMKGITHGACDYLLKPVRKEELKNIWQHVIRRKKFDSKDQHNSDNSDQPHGGQGTGSSDRNGKLNRKRKDQNEDEDEECEENDHENEDPSAQKKPRVVWSVELHRKFVAAVNQLGIDKAVPKRILDLMGVDKLTRENVASHLQKYRLYLKRISCVASQQANMVAALGGKDSSYLHMGSLDRLGDFHAFAGSGQLSNASITSFSPGGMLGRLNSPSNLGLHGLASSGMIQLGRAQNSGNSINDLSKVQQVVLQGNQKGNLLQGMPISLELDQLQQNKCNSRIGDFSTLIDDPMVFPVSSGFPDNGVPIGSSINSFFNLSNNPLMLQGPNPPIQSRGIGNQSSIRMTALNPEAFGVDNGASSHFTDQNRCNNNWQNAVPLTGFPSNALSLSDSVSRTNLSPTNLSGNISSMVSRIGSNPIDTSPNTVLPVSLQDSRRDIQCQAGPIGNSVRHDTLPFSSFGSLGNGVSQVANFSQIQKQDYTHNSNLNFGSLNSTLPNNGVLGSLDQSLGSNQPVYNRQMSVSLIGQSNSCDPFFIQHNEVDKSATEATMKSKDGFIQNSCGSLEDIMSAMIKQERDDAALMDGNMGW